VREPKPIRGARTPLFERLSDRNPNERRELRPDRALDRAALKQSVREEIARLLNTRCSSWQGSGTVLEYGLPDFSWMSAASESDRQMLADTIARKVAQFEPRVSDVKVTLERDATNPRAVVGSLDFNLVVESVREPVSFPLLALKTTGEIKVGEAKSAAHGG